MEANNAKLRDAMVEIVEMVKDYRKNPGVDCEYADGYLEDICDVAKEALDAPARECDRFADVTQSTALHKAFIEHCNRCERGCPMGCDHRRIIGMEKVGATTPLELMLNSQCASILECFARFVLSKATKEGED